MVILLVIAFLGALIWISARDAPSPTRGLVIMGLTTLFLTLPSLALAIGAVT